IASRLKFHSPLPSLLSIATFPPPPSSPPSYTSCAGSLAPMRTPPASAGALVRAFFVAGDCRSPRDLTLSPPCILSPATSFPARFFIPIYAGSLPPMRAPHAPSIRRGVGPRPLRSCRPQGAYSHSFLPPLRCYVLPPFLPLQLRRVPKPHVHATSVSRGVGPRSLRCCRPQGAVHPLTPAMQAPFSRLLSCLLSSSRCGRKVESQLPNFFHPSPPSHTHPRVFPSYAGSLAPMRTPPASGGALVRALFVAADRRVPRIRVETRQAAQLMGKRILVAIDSWQPDSAFPSGHYVKTLGDIGDRETESELLLMENDIDARPFSQQVLACLPPLPWSVSPLDVTDPRTKREDLRHMRVFSVDPIGCRDIDDALHCVPLPNGNFDVGVHIADVTNFVLPGTPLDVEASQRGTSVYLVERRIDMLPKPLTEDICSLRGGVERLAFSCIWEMTPEAEIVSVRFTKSVIKSAAALSYVEAQARMDDERMHDDLTRDLRNLNRLAKVMRQRRIDRGALTLASPEVKFEIDTETHDPLDVGMYLVREANHMIEEFMLAANVSVAEKILQHFASCSLLRRHPTPSPNMFEPLLRTAEAVGIAVDTSSSKNLADSLDRAVGPDPYFNKLIRILTTRCMTQAVYFPSGQLAPAEYHHYGLAAPIYTHFTSPIRRYADVVVHRLLAAAIGLTPLPDQTKDKSALTALTDNLNYRNRNAQMAGRASVELHTLIFFRTRPTDAEGRIVMVRSNGLIVFVPKYGIEGPVYLVPKEPPKGKAAAVAAANKLDGNAPSSDWVVDEKSQTVESKDGKRRFKVLDTVTVHIEVIEPQPNRPKLSLTLVSQ
ncbi:unnamed protein product, partial [Closterium sp. NIES-54]